MMSQSNLSEPMKETSPNLFDRHARSNWIRLRTLIVLRWIAIIGQIAAITLARQYFDLQMALGPIFMVIGASVIVNLVAMFIFPANHRLTENQTALMFLFDISQLAMLTFLTGGLHNPFALLILAPVTIAATVLNLRSILWLGGIALALTSLLAIYHMPLRTEQGIIYRLPDLFIFGFWAAIVIGTIFLGLYARRVTSEVNSMSEALLATQMALSREQKLTDLGGVVAAAAHELGTPLATITLVSSEMLDEIGDQPMLREDAELILEQAKRCRDILRSMGRAGKDDLHLRQAPLEAVVREAAEPHLHRGKTIHFGFPQAGPGGPRQSNIHRQPEIIHGLRNLIQNAVDFADSSVWVDAFFNADTISLRIIDDGKGFPVDMVGRIGDPFVRRRSGAADQRTRPAYEGMGLGLFIAKTLLERTGAELSFDNASDPFLSESELPIKKGAIVEVIWPRVRLQPQSTPGDSGLGENLPFDY